MFNDTRTMPSQRSRTRTGAHVGATWHCSHVEYSYLYSYLETAFHSAYPPCRVFSLT